MKKLWKKCRAELSNDRWDLEIVLGLAGLIIVFMVTVTGYELSRVVWDQPLLVVSLDDAATTLAADNAEILEVSAETTASKGTFALHQVGLAIEALAIAGAASCIFFIVCDARNKAPFTFSNFRRLRLAGWLMVIGLVGSLLRSFAILDAASEVSTPQTTISFAWIGPAAIFMALAKIWSHGVKMREDMELTV